MKAMHFGVFKKVTMYDGQRGQRMLHVILKTTVIGIEDLMPIILLCLLHSPPSFACFLFPLLTPSNEAQISIRSFPKIYGF